MDAAACMTTEDLAFELPDELIAQHPAPERGGSQLMVLEHGSGDPARIGRFDELLLQQLRPGDLVVANDSRVLKARVPIRRPGGGLGELLLLHPVSDPHGATIWSAMARPARRLRPGMRVLADPAGEPINMVERTSPQTWLVELPCRCDEVASWLERVGTLPLPPYIEARSQDELRYQTVHARHDGSVAAPTAGLHFDEPLWDAIRARCEVAHLTLHVGAGTFLPIQDGPLSSHVMHHERYEVPPATDAAVRAALDAGRRIVAVGTTSTRVLEHVYGAGGAPLTGDTDLFIQPGHAWRCVGAMLTNFHLPRSTLLALVMAFHGEQAIRDAYAHAIERRMRFYSFGDAMLLPGPPVHDGRARRSLQGSRP